MRPRSAFRTIARSVLILGMFSGTRAHAYVWVSRGFCWAVQAPTSMNAGTQYTISVRVAMVACRSTSGVGITGGVDGLNIVQTTPT